MGGLEELLSKWGVWIFSSVVAVTVWLVRLESIGKTNSKVIDELKQSQKETAAKVEASEKRVEDKLDTLRQETNQNFALINKSLQEVLLKITRG